MVDGYSSGRPHCEGGKGNSSGGYPEMLWGHRENNKLKPEGQLALF